MRKFLLLVILMFFHLRVSAQNYIDNNLTFIYINHTTDTPVHLLCKRLDNEFKNARRFSKPLIIYLSNGENPYVATVGIDGLDEENYDDIIRALQEKRFHFVDPRIDVLNILDLFNRYNFLQMNGMPKYSSLVWQFYINQDFWSANYNEQIIAKLYYTLDLDTLSSDYLHLMILYSGEKELVYNKECPFGVKNLCRNLRKLEFLNY